MPTLKELWTQYEGKVEEQKARLAKMDSGEATAEEAMAATKANEELADLTQQIEAFGNPSALRGEFAKYADLAGKPILGVPHPSQGGQTVADNGVNILGLVPSGYADIDGSNGRMIEVKQVGAGLMDAHQVDAIRQDDYAKVWRKYVRVGWHNLSNTEQKTLQEAQDVSGGYLAPEQIVAQVIAKEPTPTRVNGFVTQMNTTRDSLAIPKVNYTTDDIYTTGMRVTWSGEVPASAASINVKTATGSAEPQFGAVRVPVYSAMMSIAVTNDLIEDSAVNLMSWLSGKFGETVDLLMDNMILNGTGINQPSGMLLSPGGAGQPRVVNSGSASTLTGDGIMDLVMSLPEQYDENARLVFNKTNTGRALRKLKDGQGRYLWGDGMQDSGLATARPQTIAGYPYSYSAFMPDTAAGKYPILFGDFRGYYLVKRIGFSVQVLRELYAETNQVLLLGRVRFGGMTAEEWRIFAQCVSA